MGRDRLPDIYTFAATSVVSVKSLVSMKGYYASVIGSLELLVDTRCALVLDLSSVAKSSFNRGNVG